MAPPPYRVLPRPKTRRILSEWLENALVWARKTLTLDDQKLGCAANAGLMAGAGFPDI
jgi:hypothetical protein